MGCDTVSACAGPGKKRILKHVKTNKTYEEAFCWLGRTWDVSAELFQKLLAVCIIPSTDATRVNDLQYQLFCVQRGEVDSSELPPCEDCLFVHVLRANYQASVWRCCKGGHLYQVQSNCWTTYDNGQLAIE